MRALPLLAVFGMVAPLFAANWPAWRGPTHDGVTEETNLPLRWSATQNVKWKTPLPDRGNSTPVVWGERVFVTQATEKDHRRALMCFDKRTGKLLWSAGITCHDNEPTHATNPYCSASPATDGDCVVVSFGSAVHCYDFSGAERWKRDDLGVQKQIWGNGASPVIAGERVFFNFGPGEKTVLYCFDKKTGRTLWEHAEPGGNTGEAGGAAWIGSWNDPLLRRVGARDELFMHWPGRVCAYDPATGAERWSCDGLTALAYNSPLFADGAVVAMGGFNGAALAVRAGGSGNVTATHRLWLLPKVTQRIGSGVLYEGHHYILTDGATAECRDLKTGALVFSERLKGPGATAQNWSSLVRSGDKLYAVNQGGDAFVWRAAPKFELLATNAIGEKVIGSMAVSDGKIFIRSYRHLWCIGE
ncbi:MAG: PQQ-binding-like beta-propeller repeat protein [Verrucomicrobia bacterium]|nr:PQQ-binding-like beta-propeller repeat protein [Verrucomicrobiota bacterium]